MKTMNLIKVKVVDEDAVVISKRDSDRLLTYARLLESSLIRMGHSPSLLIEEVYKQFNPTPPVQEPTNFGAIVEATHAGTKDLFFNDGTNNVPWVARQLQVNCFWDELINPVVISEGLK